MSSLAHSLPSAGQPLAAITADGATLPVIRAAGFEARVNAYVVGATERLRRRTPVSPIAQHTPTCISPASPGCSGGATDLWYLSLVAPRGHGTTLRAIWANLVGNTHHAVWLEGVGTVALGHQRLDLSDSASGSGGLGYPIHWTYRQAPVPPSRDVQAVLESDLLTYYDPLLTRVVTRAPRTARGTAGGRRASAHARTDRLDRGAATLTSSTSAGASGTQEDETRAREAHPLFLLLACPGPAADPERTEQGSAIKTSESWLARLHLRYLATRIPWLPYYPAWAAYLWRRALARGEAEHLYVWSYGATDGEDAMSSRTTPYFSAAYLCRPDPLALTADLSRAIAAGTFNDEHCDDGALAASAEDERAA